MGPLESVIYFTAAHFKKRCKAMPRCSSVFGPDADLRSPPLSIKILLLRMQVWWYLIFNKLERNRREKKFSLKLF
jgi:hypothetical protein